MATTPEKKSPKPAKTLRQTPQNISSNKGKRIIKQSAKKIAIPFKHAKNIGKKEYYIPLPKHKVSTFLNKKRRITPGYFRSSWKEVKEVSWPDRKTTAKLTMAVLAFATVFGVAIAIVDYGLDKIFRALLLQ